MFTKITQDDLQNKGVVGLPDTPNLSTHDMQAKFDEIATDVIVPAVNNLIDELEASTAADNIGAKDGEDDSTIQDILDALSSAASDLEDLKHSHDNKTTLDNITATLLSNINALLLMMTGITSVAGSVTDTPNAIPTCKAIVNYVSMLGGGDMMKSTYDQDNDGVVDDSEKLGGELPSYYQKATDSDLTTTDKTTTGAINELASTIGDLDDLDTSVKTDVVSAINDARENAIECVGGSTIETIGDGAIGSYAVDDLFVADDGYVYKATAIIAPTNTLTVGSNCSKTNIKAELNSAITAMANKVNKFTGGGYVPVDSLAYDSTNKKLGLKVNGADTVIPFSGSSEIFMFFFSFISYKAIIVENGEETFLNLTTRADLINYLNAHTYENYDTFSAVAGTSYVIECVIKKAGYYYVGYNDTGLQYKNVGDTMRLSGDQINYYCGTTNPYA